MSNIAQKIALTKNLEAYTERKNAENHQFRGEFYPAKLVSKTSNSGIVTVDVLLSSDYPIPNITCPLMGPEYIRYPLQPGDKGILIPTFMFLGGVSGLGNGTATLTNRPGNLSTYFFIPLGNTGWSTVDGNTLVMYGPNGVQIRDSGSNSVINITPTTISIQAPNSVTSICGGTKIALTPSGWTISGTSGALSDSSGETSPAKMLTAWTALLNFCNNHVHGNGNGGANTTASTTQINTPIVS
jgi:hypothetical protein